MTQYDKRWLRLFALTVLVCASTWNDVTAKRTNGGDANLTACQHLRRAESRRSKALLSATVDVGRERSSVRVPRCNRKDGAFEEIQCRSEKTGSDCWCVDEYGVEIPGTRNTTKSSVRCAEPTHCPASACRMFCPAGFVRDAQTGCSLCRCRDPCENIDCPNGQSCQVQEVKCKLEPCPPVPTCKKARSIANYCPAGLPLAIDDSVPRPFLCGLEDGKPQCPPLYRCIVESGNDYGVCCPSAAVKFKKPGFCPAPETMDYTERTGFMCGTPCTQDLECRNMEKCCLTKGCHMNCQQPHNVTTCHQARALSDVLAINDREGRGYVPNCTGPGGMFSPRQCSRNGLVCWCVDPRTGHKIPNSMGAANVVNCDDWENMIVSRALGRSIDMEHCDTNICAAVCEYGFKNDHNGCPTCECSEPCEGFTCAMGSHCEVAADPLCESGSALCTSWPVCKLDLVYSNPCDVGTPLTDNATSEVMYCLQERQSRAFQATAFFEPEPVEKQSRSMSNRIMCPASHRCTKLHREAESVCCPLPLEADAAAVGDDKPQRQQTMCEYLRDFSERMEGTEAGMQLAIAAPRCTDDGNYQARQCSMRKIRVTRAEQREILEANTIRRMRMLLQSVAAPTSTSTLSTQTQTQTTTTARNKRDVGEKQRLKLYRVDDSALRVQVAPATPPPVAAQITGRSAKVIDGGDRQQQLFATDFKKGQPAPKRPTKDNDLVEVEVEECWCVDSFGTEIPRSRAFNVSDESCAQLREQVDCLDLTCRMGCEYGFTLDPDTRCPACQCRDPCDGVSCGEGTECRIVDVSCEEEYCPPVPACLPRKPGQCPFLVPPGPDNLDANSCAYECRTDSHCADAKRCCSNGCGTQCVQPQMKTACQHLQAIQMHQSSELGIPAMKMHIALCDVATGRWNPVQCSPDGYCWCLEDGVGLQEMSGTRVKGDSPVCKENSAHQCPPAQQCKTVCESGFKVDEHGCRTCECGNFCDEISCASGEECQLISVECIDAPCPKMPICVPRRESVCPEGNPLRQGELEVSCGPHNENEVCPTTHTCQLNPVTHRGVCCRKTRDVCFESIDNVCLAKSTSAHNATRYRFSPKANKCVAITIDVDAPMCQTKNLFHNELACNSVCPVLTQCERLKLKNSLAAQRTGHSSVWFQPRCDPVSGHWSPVQCLGEQPALESTVVESTPPPTGSGGASSRAFESYYDLPVESTPYGGVCWCSDKKGAPLKGTLTRDIEPVCNSRQARRRNMPPPNDGDALMEQLIHQVTMLNDIDSFFDDDEIVRDKDYAGATEARQLHPDRDSLAMESASGATAASALASSVTERLELANSLLDSKLSVFEATVQPMQVKTTRCRALLAQTTSFPVACDDSGAFVATQCNGKLCWCVDAAGNQLDESNMFRRGTKRCEPTPIGSVAVELHLQNSSGQSVRNLYDTVRTELHRLLKGAAENLRVQENFDGSAVVRFELHRDDKIDLAFAIESAVSAGDFRLAGGHFRPDITRSHFIHRVTSPPLAQAVTSPESTIQLVLFIMATSSAFLVSVFVVYVMLKRGRRKGIGMHAGYPVTIYEYQSPSKAVGSGDKPLDYSAPIFVLSAANEHDSIRQTHTLAETSPSMHFADEQSQPVEQKEKNNTLS